MVIHGSVERRCVEYRDIMHERKCIINKPLDHWTHYEPADDELTFISIIECSLAFAGLFNQLLIIIS